MTDWSDFGSSLLATFIGVLLALAGERLYDCYKDWREGVNLIKMFQRELSTTKDIIEKVNSATNMTWINPIKVPIWESVINTNRISLLSSHMWYSDLLSLYDDIKDYNEWHLIRTKQYYRDADVSRISSSLSESYIAIIKKIDTLLDAMNK